MLVKFIKNHTPYLAGETADFPKQRADSLIAAKVVVSEAPAVAVQEVALVVEDVRPVAPERPADRSFTKPARGVVRK